MSLFDELAGAAKGTLYQAAESGAQAAVASALQNSGGLQGILDKLHAGGLSQVVESWSGAGNGQPISADQLKSLLGDSHITQIASALGLPAEQTLAALAEHLPALAANAKT
jgi:uncharacterized protein YidB (DUF937 family)